MKNLKIKFIILLVVLFSTTNFYGQNTCTNNCGSISAGPNKSICCPGGSVSIGGSPCYSPGTYNCASVSYSWAPSTGLSCTNCCNPTASPNTTTTYTLYVTFPNNCCCDGPIGNCAVGTCTLVRTATVKVTVNNTCCRLIKPEQEKDLANSDINLFPNPSEGKFTLQFNQINVGTCVIIYDANGKLVKTDENISPDNYLENNKQLTYDLSSQTKGIYYIKIVEGESTIYFKKLVLQ